MTSLPVLVAFFIGGFAGQSAGQTATCGNPSPSLVSRWSGEGNAYDSAGSSNGKLQGTFAFPAGKIGQSFGFDGTNYVSIANARELSPSQELTIDAWFQPVNTGGPQAQFLVNKGDWGSDRSYSLAIVPSGALVFHLLTEVVDRELVAFPPSASVYDQQFHHIAATYDGADMKLYLDGILIGHQAATGVIHQAQQDVFLGSGSNRGGLYTGRLDEVEIYNAALCASDIAALHNGRSTAVVAPAVQACFGDVALLDDDFNLERNGAGVFNYASFTKWDVTSGTVDLIGNRFWNFFPTHPEYGLYIDTDGTSGKAGRMASKTAFALSPGTYELRFDLAGAQRLVADLSDTVIVSLGSTYEERFTLDYREPFRTVVRTITVTVPVSRRLVFEALGGDGVGLLLDNVRFTRVCRTAPLPSVTGGLPQDGGVLGPGVPGDPGRVPTLVTGTGHEGCTIQLTAADLLHPGSAANNQTLSTTVHPDDTWSLPVTFDDGSPVVEVVQICNGPASDPLRRQIFVDGTPPFSTLGDGDVFVPADGIGQVTLVAGASDPGSSVPGNALRYRWMLQVDNGWTLLCEGCPGTLTIEKAVGDYTIAAVITDSAGNRTTRVARRRMLRRPTALSCASNAVSLGGLVTLSSTLTDFLSGGALAAEPITYTIDGSPVSNPLEADLLPGAHAVTASFAGDGIYGASVSANSCSLYVESTPGKITGRGSVDNGVRRFGLEAQTKLHGGAALYTGSLEFQDTARGIELHSLTILLIAASSDRLHAVITGTATLNGANGFTFAAWIDDRGEPGRGQDKFRIEITGPAGFGYDSNTYAILGGKLDKGGNIQIHKASPASR